MHARALRRLFSFALALAACTAPEDGESEAVRGVGGKADDVGDAEAFFGPDTFYVFQIENWDPARMANATLRDEVCSGDPGLESATLTVARADPGDASHCPSIAPDDVLVQTTDFCMRTSGNMTNGTPKSSYKLSFEEKDERIGGMKKINLKSMWNDVSQLRESLAWRMFDEAHLPAQRHTYARLCMDPSGSAGNVYRGLYSVIEQVDKTFLKARFGSNDDGSHLSNQVLPPLPAEAEAPGSDVMVLPGVVEYLVDADGDGHADGDLPPLLHRP